MESSIQIVEINAPKCPFCHSEQQKIASKSNDLQLYNFCRCAKMQQYLNTQRDLIDRKEKMKYIDEELLNYKKYAEKLINASNLGRRFTSRTFENFDKAYAESQYKVALRYAENFRNNEGEGLIFTGEVGTGKTHLAAAIANYVIAEYALPVRFGCFADILDGIRNSFSGDQISGIEIEKELYEVPLLIIDDLGKERQTQFAEEMLFKVVNHRYEAELPLIITSNYDLEELSDRLDYSTFSRLAEMCRGVKMTGSDYRLREYLMR